MHHPLSGTALTVWALAVAAFDWRQRRVPNPALILVVVPALLALVVYRKGLLEIEVWESLAGFAFGTVILLPGYIAKQLGAGDVKLAAVMGLLLGIRNLLPALLVAGLTIGLMAVAAKIKFRKSENQSYRLPGAVALVVGFEWSLWHKVVMGATGQ